MPGSIVLNRGAVIVACAVLPLLVGLLTPFLGFFCYGVFISELLPGPAAARAIAAHSRVTREVWSYSFLITLLPFELMSIYLVLWSFSLSSRRCFLALAAGLLCALAGMLPVYSTIWSLTTGAAVSIVLLCAAAIAGQVAWREPARSA